MIKILSVAGYDGSGGAGITSDAKIFSKLGIYGLSVITAMTAQNPDKVYRVSAVSDKFFEAELKAIFGYFSVDGIKVGILSNENQALILKRYIKRYNIKLVVIDPVYISTSNKRFFADKNNYPDFLFPLFKFTTIITPNIKEAELISGITIKDENEMRESAKIIKEKFLGIKNIVVKGSHLKAPLNSNVIHNIAIDCKDNFYSFELKRIKLNREIHGTGCAFSGGLTAYTAKGLDFKDAVINAEKLVSKFIRNFEKLPDNSNDKNIYIAANI